MTARASAPSSAPPPPWQHGQSAPIDSFQTVLAQIGAATDAHLAAALRTTLDAEVVGIYAPSHAALRQVGLARATSNQLPPAVRRKLRAIAAEALTRATDLASSVHGGTGVEEVVALPLGSAEQRAILVIARASAEDAQGGAARSRLLKQATELRPLIEAVRANRPRRRAGVAAAARVVDALERSPDAAIVVSGDLRILGMNPAGARLFPPAPIPASGQSCAEVLRCRDTSGAVLCGTSGCPARRALESGEGWSYPVLRLGVDPSHTSGVSLTTSPLGGRSKPSAVLLSARALPARQETGPAQANFLSMVSHELRTPLNAINGFLEIVLDGYVGALAEKQQEFLEYAHTSTQHLTRLVEDVLLLSKADAGQFALRPAPVDVPLLLAQSANLLRPEAEARSIRLDVELEPHLPAPLADGLRIQQVLTNLVSNALAHTPDGGQVALSAALDGSCILFTITDTGPGVAPAERERIFERFYRSEESARVHPGGSGLGLAIAQLVVEQHGGRIWVDDAPGGGARFRFTLPLPGTPS